MRTRKLRINRIMNASKNGRGVWVELISGVKVCLPKNHVKFRTEEYGGQIAIIPKWVEIKKMYHNAQENCH